MPSAQINRSIRIKGEVWWLPEKYRHLDEPLRITFRPSIGERRLLRKRKKVAPSVWAPKNRVVTYGPLAGSRWDNNFMPHTRGIMDASFYPSVRIIGNIKAPQTGSSAANETMLGYIADMQPGDAFITYPDRDTAAKRSTDYLQPMFKRSPRLRELLTGTADDLASLRLKLKTMLIYMGWAGSVTSLGNISARYLFGDEIDKWIKQASKKEADTLKLFLERFTAFEFNGKAWLISTPTDEDGYITQYLKNTAQLVFDYWIPCPECGESHKMRFGCIDFGGSRDPREVEDKDLARYVFPCCGLVGDDRVRKRALEQGFWCERLPEEREKAGDKPRELFAALTEDNPKYICFHSPAWVSKLNSHAKMAAAFLRGLQDPGEMHYFDNQIAAVAHTPYRQHRKQDTILALRDDRPEGLVPGGGQVSALVAGVDTQDNSFPFVIRAFGWGLKLPSWLIRFGEVDSLAALHQVLFDDIYRDVDGLYYPVILTVIDTGGHRTSEVYDFARMNPSRVAAYNGASGRRAMPWKKSRMDRYPGTNVPIPGGVELYTCDPHHYMDQLSAKLAIKPDDPGAYRFHQDITDEFATQLCAEYLNDKRLWICPKNRANHFGDCEKQTLVAADLLQLKYQEKGE